jgi:hypothetical protein
LTTRISDELGCVPGVLSAEDVELARPLQLVADRRQPLVADGTGERIDDESDPHSVRMP